MSQVTSWTVGANQSGLAYRTADNDRQSAVVSNSKGNSAPADKLSGMFWMDDTTTPWILKVWDGAQWIAFATFNSTTHAIQLYNGTTVLAAASTSGAGIIQLATNAQAITGTSTTLGVVPANLPAVNQVLAHNYGGTSGGSANAQTISLAPAIGSYAAPLFVVFKAGFTNTGAMTVNVNSLGTKNIKKYIAGALADPESGDISTGDIVTLMYDGTQFVLLGFPKRSGYRLGSIQTFIASGTWTRPAGCRAIEIELVGSGGGGGGVTNVANANAAGGGAGGYSRKWILNPPNATETVTIGAAGTAGANTGGTGGTGGTVQFGAHAQATGGVGGQGATGIGNVIGGTPGLGSSGDTNTPGAAGGNGHGAAALNIVGLGGNSHFSGGGYNSPAGGQGGDGSVGSGGAGASRLAAAAIGGVGGIGYIIVREFY